MDEIKAGEWVRFKDGIVDRIKDIIKTQGDRKLITFEKMNICKSDLGLEKQLKTHSKNKIDIIEVGDYVNGYEVLDKYLFNGEMPVLETTGDYTNAKCLCDSDIKNIVTKEQFESRKYNFEEE